MTIHGRGPLHCARRLALGAVICALAWLPSGCTDPLGLAEGNSLQTVSATPTQGLRTTEAGGTTRIYFVLKSAPISPVTVPVRSSDTGEGVVSPAKVKFSASNWSVPKTVTVTGVDDALIDGNKEFYVIVDSAISSDPAFDGATVSNITVVNEDDDSGGITVTPTAGLATTEGGGIATFDVVLTAQPAAVVTIPISSSDTTEGTTNTALLTFTVGNWDLPQTVTVTGVNDDFDDGNIGFTVYVDPATSSDLAFDGFDPSDVTVTNQDDDTANVMVSTGGPLITTEAGGIATFTVVLTSEPLFAVTVDLSSTNVFEGRVGPAQLTFTAGNWNFAQTVFVTGQNDLTVDGTVAYTVLVAASVSSDPLYNGIDAPDVSMSNTDDDVADVLVQAFADQSSATPMGVALYGGNLFSVGNAISPGFARYFPDGSLAAIAVTAIDTRAIVAKEAGVMLVKAFGVNGSVYEISTAGTLTFRYDLNDSQPQGKVAFNANGAELYLRDGAAVRRYDSGSGALLGSFTLAGLAAPELAFPAAYQLSTSDDGRIFTYANGVVSEWNLAGARLADIAVPIATPVGNSTTWSFSVANNGLAYLYNEVSSNWEGYYIGVGDHPAQRVQSIADQTGSTPMGGTWDGVNHYTVSGGNSSGLRFARYLANGTLAATYAPGLDFRSLIASDAGQLYAKAFAGAVYSFTFDGIPTPLYTLAEPNSQAKAAFNGPDSELYVRDGATVRRYNSGSGALIGSFTLSGPTAEELASPADVSIATRPNGSIYTYANGWISEWNLAGTRLRRMWVPIATPAISSTTWSFSVGGDGNAYLYNSNTAQWDVFKF